MISKVIQLVIKLKLDDIKCSNDGEKIELNNIGLV